MKKNNLHPVVSYQSGSYEKESNSKQKNIMCKTRTRIEQCNIQKEREQQRLFGVCCFYFAQRVNISSSKRNG